MQFISVVQKRIYLKMKHTCKLFYSPIKCKLVHNNEVGMLNHVLSKTFGLVSNSDQTSLAD